jgi:hypothetical protein
MLFFAIFGHENRIPIGGFSAIHFMRRHRSNGSLAAAIISMHS